MNPVFKQHLISVQNLFQLPSELAIGNSMAPHPRKTVTAPKHSWRGAQTEKRDPLATSPTLDEKQADLFHSVEAPAFCLKQVAFLMPLASSTLEWQPTSPPRQGPSDPDPSTTPAETAHPGGITDFELKPLTARTHLGFLTHVDVQRGNGGLCSQETSFSPGSTGSGCCVVNDDRNSKGIGDDPSGTLRDPLERALGSWPDSADACGGGVTPSPGVAVWRGSACGGVKGRNQRPGHVESYQ